jgi:hypothetical protein
VGQLNSTWEPLLLIILPASQPQAVSPAAVERRVAAKSVLSHCVMLALEASTLPGEDSRSDPLDLLKQPIGRGGASSHNHDKFTAHCPELFLPESTSDGTVLALTPSPCRPANSLHSVK